MQLAFIRPKHAQLLNGLCWKYFTGNNKTNEREPGLYAMIHVHTNILLAAKQGVTWSLHVLEEEYINNYYYLYMT